MVAVRKVKIDEPEAEDNEAVQLGIQPGDLLAGPEYETSENLDKLAKAFVAFRAACPNVDKDREGYNYNYATLGNIIEKSREHLKKQGLAITQFPIAGVQSLGVITVLMHESGQFIRARFLMPIPDLSSANVTQAAGAAITYARRYALAAVLCIAADQDTDAAYEEPEEEPVKRAPVKVKRRG